MNHTKVRYCLLFGAISLLSAGCHKEPTTTSAATELEHSFNLKPQAQTAAATPTSAETSAKQADNVNQAVSDATSAMRNKSYVEAFTTLHTIQAAPTLTLNQYSAIESARLAVEREMASKALAGDPAALKALQAIKKQGH